MLIPTIHFNGNCNEVIEFYKQAVGAEVQTIAYAKDAPPEVSAEMPPNFVMFSEVKIFSTTVSLTDGCENPPTENNHTFMVMLETKEDVISAFEKLSIGSKVHDIPQEVFWANLWCNFTDKFGVNWQIMTRSM